MGCGFGWHCQYAVDNGAVFVVGIDISQKMIEKAKQITNTDVIKYVCMPIEEISFSDNSFDVVISSLTFHYLESFDDILKKINKILITGGDFVFSVEHPIFTAKGSQDWIYDDKGNPLHWPVDKYYTEGLRHATFLGEKVIKYHNTLTTYLNSLIKNGFEITAVVEPAPTKEAIASILEMADELRRPIMLLVSSQKK